MCVYSIYEGGSESMGGTEVAGRVEMLAAFKAAEKKYSDLLSGFGRSVLNYGKRGRVDWKGRATGNDNFFLALKALVAGMEATSGNYKVGADMTASLEALKVFTNFLDFGTGGEKTGIEASFKDIYTGTGNGGWRLDWMYALCLLYAYIKACQDVDPTEGAALLATYDLAGMHTTIGKSIDNLKNDWGRKEKDYKAKAKVLVSFFRKSNAPTLGTMRGILTEL